MFNSIVVFNSVLVDLKKIVLSSNLVIDQASD